MVRFLQITSKIYTGKQKIFIAFYTTSCYYIYVGRVCLIRGSRLSCPAVTYASNLVCKEVDNLVIFERKDFMKRKMFKKVLSFVLMLSVFASFLCFPANAIAQTEHSSRTLSIKNTKVTLCQDALDIPDDLLSDIVSSHPDSGEIIIYNWGCAEETQPTGGLAVPKSLTYSIVRTQKTVTDASAVKSEVFKFSVGKGEEVTLSYTMSSTVSGSVTGTPYDAGQIGYNTSITGYFSAGVTYHGPSESSPYNSRQYWLRFFEERGNYTQYRDYYNGADSSYLYTIGPTSGTYKKPTTWASYSIDLYVG